jgi:hypothetical protein
MRGGHGCAMASKALGCEVVRINGFIKRLGVYIGSERSHEDLMTHGRNHVVFWSKSE